MSGGDRTAPLGLLLLEDSPADSRLLVESLRDRVNAGTVVIQTVRRLADALRELKRFRFSCVLVDLGLPDGQGVDTVLRIREADEGIAIVVLTGLADQRAADEAFRLGAQDYLIKGQRLGDELLEFVQRAIEKRRRDLGPRDDVEGVAQSAASALRYQPWLHVGRGAFMGLHAQPPVALEVLPELLGAWRAWTGAGVSGRLGLSLPAACIRETLAGLRAMLPQSGVTASEIALRVPMPEPRDVAALVEPLARLRSEGVDVWLEGWRPDRGRLETLSELPLDGLVLDPQLVAAVAADGAESTLRFVRASLALSGALGLQVLADGVTFAEQHNRLSLLGCELMQGSWFCGAESAADVVARWSKGPRGLQH